MIAISLALFVYNAEEADDALIEQLSREKDLIIRYGAMYCIGMAYCGSGNTAMLQKLIKFYVSDVIDGVRRAALINIEFFEIRSPDTTLKQEKGIKEYTEKLQIFLKDKNEHLIIKFGT